MQRDGADRGRSVFVLVHRRQAVGGRLFHVGRHALAEEGGDHVGLQPLARVVRVHAVVVLQNLEHLGFVVDDKLLAMPASHPDDGVVELARKLLHVVVAHAVSSAYWRLSLLNMSSVLAHRRMRGIVRTW